MKRGYNRQEVADALYASVMGGEHMAPTGIDKLLQYEGTIANRGGVLPLMRRVVPDIGGDDISEFEGPLELAVPGLLYDPLSSMAKVGAMATGDMKINPDIITNAAVDAPLMGSLLSGATGAVPRGAVLGANVFHGGPHRWSPEPDFPHGRPRLDKMGTGEGHQAYGYGFYSADAPGVAQTYKTPEGSYQRLTGQMDPKTEFAFDLMEQGQSTSKIMEMMLGKYGGNITFDEAVKAIDGARDIGAGQGTLYKLDIPDADVAKYLDYDKPLSEQPKGILEKIKPMILNARGYDPSTGTDSNLSRIISASGNLRPEITGEMFYRGLAKDLGGDQAASEALRKAGIPGLKYFDQDSRGPAPRIEKSDAGFQVFWGNDPRPVGTFDTMKAARIAADEIDGRTRNYVTWDQDVLDRSKMLERDGVTLGANKGPTAALPGLLMKSGERKLLYDAPYSNYKIDPGLPELLKRGTTVKQTSDYVPTKTISPEDLASDGYLLNLVGDRTDVGNITRLLGEDLDVPISLQGGMGYMRGKGTGAWASDPNVIRSLSKKVQSAEGQPVYGTYNAMSGTSSDFANMTRDVALRNFDPKDLRKKDVKDFNQRFRKQKESEALTKDFPGLDSPELNAWLDKSGTRRAALFKFMDKAEWRDKGFPNITQARYAIQDPLLRDLPAGVEQYAGQSIARMDAAGTQRPTSELSMPHGTYSVDLAGDYLGGLERAVPRSVLFPEWYNLRRQSNSPMASDNRAFQMTPVLQPTNDEWLSGVMRYLESNR
tara:strand:+ start:132 stop:2435 length:2304 start_codon:yes stop_codon:yes gene_type:complete